MSSYPPGGDYDERLLDNAPRATKAELQEGYNVNLLASDSSDSPMNARTQPTIDGHASLEAANPPTKEGYSLSYSTPWYRQKKWRVAMLIGVIIVVGAIVGGVVGGTVGHKSKNETSKPGPSTVSVSSVTSSIDTSIAGPIQPTEVGPLSSTSTSPPQSTTGAAASPTGTGRPPTIAGNVVDLEEVPV